MTIEREVYYVLDGDGNAATVPDIDAWCEWFKTADRQVAKDEIKGLVVSTVFLASDHNFGGGSPLLWETMIFPTDTWDEEYQERYSSRAAAVEGHARACEWVRRERYG